MRTSKSGNYILTFDEFSKYLAAGDEMEFIYRGELHNLNVVMHNNLKKYILVKPNKKFFWEFYSIKELNSCPVFFGMTFEEAMDKLEFILF